MIPKIIHYCWFGGKNMPLETRVLIKEWHLRMPDYQIKCWNEKTFDISSIPWVKQAIENKKWAFAADYVRLYALYTEGGIYMDTDVEVFKPFDIFLKYSFFSSVEIHDGFEEQGRIKLGKDDLPLIPGDIIPNLGILSAIVGAEKENIYIKQCLSFYDKNSFVKKDGTLFTDIIIPDFLAREAVDYGFRYKDETQYIKNNMVVFKSSVFVGDYMCMKKDSYALHFCYGTWRNIPYKQRIKWWLKHKKWAIKKYYFLIKNS
jgi:hypothetical protein